MMPYMVNSALSWDSKMKVKTLEGYSVDWKVNGKEVNLDKRDRSNLHIQARKILRAKYATLQILEEVPIPIRQGKTLYLDFYIPVKKLAIEVHGEQHYAYSSFFHKSPQDFIQQRKNDSDKLEWAEINGLTVKILPFDKVEEWENIL